MRVSLIALLLSAALCLPGPVDAAEPADTAASWARHGALAAQHAQLSSQPEAAAARESLDLAMAALARVASALDAAGPDASLDALSVRRQLLLAHAALSLAGRQIALQRTARVRRQAARDARAAEAAARAASRALAQTHASVATGPAPRSDGGALPAPGSAERAAP